MQINKTGHEDFLELASKRMIRYPQSKKFIRWVCRYLYLHMRATQATVALFDAASSSFHIRVSEGKHRIPTGLISIQPESPLVNWFQAHEPNPCHVNRTSQLITGQRLMAEHPEGSEDILEELLRHHVEVCAKVQTHDRLAGYLLIGPRESGLQYNGDDVKFIQILANDIAIEIEKDEYYHSSYHDHLTGLLNRHSLEGKLSSLMQTAKAQHGEFALAIIDVDDFKQINDTHGHLVGDEVLKTVARIIASSIRKTDLAFRYGGEEFLILLRMNSRDPEREFIPSEEFRRGIKGVLERVRYNVCKRPLNAMGHDLNLSVSTGLSFFRGDYLKLSEDVVREADQALYIAKQRGKNCVCVFPHLD